METLPENRLMLRAILEELGVRKGDRVEIRRKAEGGDERILQIDLSYFWQDDPKDVPGSTD
jgi:Fe2+ transport system protein FeoA